MKRERGRGRERDEGRERRGGFSREVIHRAEQRDFGITTE